MKIAKFVLPVIAAGFTATSASAAISATNTVILGSGVVENSHSIDTTSDFLSAVVFVELTTGTVHNPNSIVPGVESFQNGANDTFFGANGNPAVALAGGAGDLGHLNPNAEVGPTVLGVTWNSPGADTDDIGNGLPIGSFSFTNDATGTWSLLLTNAEGDRVITSGTVEAGAMVPEPASLALMGLGGLAAMRRRR